MICFFGPSKFEALYQKNTLDRAAPERAGRTSKLKFQTGHCSNTGPQEWDSCQLEWHFYALLQGFTNFRAQLPTKRNDPRSRCCRRSWRMAWARPRRSPDEGDLDVLTFTGKEQNWVGHRLRPKCQVSAQRRGVCWSQRSCGTFFSAGIFIKHQRSSKKNSECEEWRNDRRNGVKVGMVRCEHHVHTS